MALPVVFIHLGAIPGYLLKAIEQALKFGNQVYLLTDSPPDSAPVKAEVIDVAPHSADKAAFQARYQHMSSNPVAFEFICIYRWFILKNFMRMQDLNQVLYLDSDVYLYSHTNEIQQHYADLSFEFAYAVPHDQQNFYWAGTACCAIWSLDGISRFCNHITALYQPGQHNFLHEKWAWHQSSGTPGGVCDMTLLYDFAKESGFLNLAIPHRGCTFDFNNRIAGNHIQNEYQFGESTQFKARTKQLVFKDDVPFCRHVPSQQDIRFFAVTEYAKLIAFSKRKGLRERIASALPWTRRN